MKLKGSRVEKELRDELLRSNVALRDGSYGRLAVALQSNDVNPACAYVVKWIHEQAEDIYAVLAPADVLLIVEVPRDEGPVSAQRADLVAYKNGSSRVQRLKIAVAEDLLAASPGDDSSE